MIHQPLGGAQGQATEIKIAAERIIKMKNKLNKILARNTNQPLEKIELEELVPSSRKYPFIDFKFEKGNGKEVLTVNNLTYQDENNKLLNKISFLHIFL